MNSAFLKIQMKQVFGLLLFLVLFFLFTDQNLHLFVNSYHSPFFDVFFKYVTFFGDGALFGVFIITFFIVKKKHCLKFVISGLLTLLITFVLKKLIFLGTPRPVEYFGEEKLHLIEGVKMCHWNTFPSGHAMAAFAMFFILFIISKSPYLKWGALSIAFLAALSRVYLSQHFLLDILVGGMLGVGIARLSNYWGILWFKQIKKKRKMAKNKISKRGLENELF
ncbi:phosphatase PAP2 family protein [Flavicella sediminum]|uniref:phosphatase PAP2 family protein n=1 Tax=Flavicella sediminum TaxID=2585141 RepID=UPI00112221F9|nr:phosphatase PAP2 family protein [Flavicella sediminum]